ncbi:MAG: RsmE family RNA methyltransferase, partial [Puniceicoccales bacterium]|nr:RsmE family RNA methyltransferase [Puniceicoccales bacterium]
MAIFYVHVAALVREGIPLELPADEAHHLLHVLRAGKSDTIILFDGQGKTAPCISLDGNGKRIIAMPGQITEHRRPKVQLHLMQGITKHASMDDILRRAAEWGVTAVHPLICKHCEMKLSNFDKRMAHWQNILINGCKQSKNPFLPQLHGPLPLPSALQENGEEKNVLRAVASLENHAISWHEFRSLHLQHASQQCVAVHLAIGPEGDFSAEEYAILRDHRFIPVRLCPRILTSETAAISLLAALQLGLEEDVTQLLAAYHASGNRYLVAALGTEMDASTARAHCQTNCADGLLVGKILESGHYSLRIFNSDGSEAE